MLQTVKCTTQGAYEIDSQRSIQTAQLLCMKSWKTGMDEVMVQKRTTMQHIWDQNADPSTPQSISFKTRLDRALSNLI